MLTLNKNIIKGSQYHNLTGKKFNRLTAIDINFDFGRVRGYYWNCICDCGNTTVVLSNNLTKGKIKSCGCLRQESMSRTGKQRKLYNNYDLSGTYGIGYFENGEEFYFDLEDYDLIKNYHWRIHNKKNPHVCTSHCIRLHRLVTNANLDKSIREIKFVDGNIFNCTKANLKLF